MVGEIRLGQDQIVLQSNKNVVLQARGQYRGGEYMHSLTPGG